MTSVVRYPAATLGEMPITAINRALGTELLPGPVFLSSIAHRHAAEKHRAEYAICFRLIRDTVAKPHFIGQAPKHPDNIELLFRIPGTNGDAVLVAISLMPDHVGRYRVRSFYRVSAAEIDSKRVRRHTFSAHA